jgi:hypothetical protein
MVDKPAFIHPPPERRHTDADDRGQLAERVKNAGPDIGEGEHPAVARLGLHENEMIQQPVFPGLILGFGIYAGFLETPRLLG